MNTTTAAPITHILSTYVSGKGDLKAALQAGPVDQRCLPQAQAVEKVRHLLEVERYTVRESTEARTVLAKWYFNAMRFVVIAEAPQL